MSHPLLHLLPLLLVCATTLPACKDAKTEPAPLAPAGMAGVGAPAAAPAAAPDVKVSARREAGTLVLTAAATATAPANTDAEEGERLAAATAHLFAQRELLREIERQQGKKLGGPEIPRLMRSVKIVRREAAPSGSPGARPGVTLELELTVDDKAAPPPKK